nr:RagB/SusD family nutrient uptake outer membrane protein [Pedobacter sp. ASV19]
MKKIIHFVLMLGSFLLLDSCKKFIEVDPPKNQAELSRIFSDDQTANSAVVGLYYQMVAGSLSIGNGGITLYTGLYSDELINTASNSVADPFRNNSLLSSNSTVRATFWTNPYKSIYQANAVLEGLDGSTTLSPGLRDQLKGEMLFIRALFYWYMLNLFGDVPLETATDYTINAVMPRTETTKVYDQIVADLLTARQLLAPNYGTSVTTRPSKGAADALLARVYLYQGKWDLAEAMASEVIGSNKYSLESLDNAFLSGSKETIYQISKSNGNTAEGAVFVPSSTSVRPAYTLSAFQMDAFEPGDNRKTKWVKSNLVGGTQYPYPYKYKVRTTTPITEFYIVQRLAEVYLIRAEARAQQNKLSGAIEDTDLLRARAGLTNALIKDTKPGIGQQELLSLIQKERQTELFAEWGHRYFDLKRTGKADEVLGVRKAPNWQPTDKLFPIPYVEIQTNTFLTQNTGYTN